MFLFAVCVVAVPFLLSLSMSSVFFLSSLCHLSFFIIVSACFLCMLMHGCVSVCVSVFACVSHKL